MTFRVTHLVVEVVNGCWNIDKIDMRPPPITGDTIATISSDVLNLPQTRFGYW